MPRWRRFQLAPLFYIAGSFYLGILLGSFLLDIWKGDSARDVKHEILRRWRQQREIFIRNNGYDKGDESSAMLGDQKRTNVLCFLVLEASQIPTKRKVIEQTWGRRCDRLLIFSDERPDDQTISLNLSDTSALEENAFASFEALTYLYNNHLTHAHWFIRVYHNSFVIVENLRKFLKDKDPSQPTFFGQALRDRRDTFVFGPAGYVMSRGALIKFGTRHESACRPVQGAECLVTSVCFRRLGIQLGNSRDAENRSLFHGIPIESVAMQDYPFWFGKQDAYKDLTKQGLQSVSDQPVTLVTASDNVTLAYEYYIYHARLFGVRQTF